MTYILIRKVSHPHYRTLFYAQLNFRAIRQIDRSDLKATSLVLAYDFRAVNLYLFNLESAFNDVDIMTNVILYVSILLGSLEHPENIVLLNVPNVAFIQRFKC